MYLLKFEIISRSDGIKLELQNNYQEFDDIQEMINWIHKNAQFFKNIKIFEMKSLSKKNEDFQADPCNISSIKIIA